MITIKRALCAGCCVAAISSGSAAWAQDSNSIETVVVTGSLENEIPELLSQTGTQVNTISASTIQNGSYVDIAQTLAAEAPGLYIVSENGAFNYVNASLQGSRTEDVLWLVDGVRINNRLYASTTPLDTLPASMVEQIQEIQGGESLFYGTQAVAGAVNIITKSFSNTPDGALTIGGDSDYGAHIDGYFRDGITDRSEFVIYASGDISKGFRSYPWADYQPGSKLFDRGYHEFTMGGKYQYTVANDLNLSASVERNIANLPFPSARYAIVTDYNQRQEDILTAKVDYTPSDDFQFFVKSYYHIWASHYTEIESNASSPNGLDVVEDDGPWGYVDRGVNAMGKFVLMPGLQSVLGYDYQNYYGSDAVLVITQHREQVNAVFGQLEALDIIPRAHFAVGFRYNAPSVGQSAFVWNASGQYDLSDALYVKGTVGTNFRLPTAEELFANDPDDERGNPNLLPERSTSANGSVGGKVNLGSVPFSWQITGFYRAIKDVIDYTSFDAATDQEVFGNVPGTVTTRGLEATLSAPITDYLSGNADFTYSHATETGQSGQFEEIPENLFKMGLDYHPTDIPFGAMVNLQYVGSIYDMVSGIGNINYGNYVVLNIGARVFLDEARQHRIGITLDNVFNEFYSTGVGRGTTTTHTSYLIQDLGQPRTVSVRYTYSFQ